MDKLTLHDLKGSVLAFDLRDLLRVLAPQSLAASWTINSPGEAAFDATGAGALRLQALADTQAQIIGEELLTIADNTVQVIWGDFVGALSTEPDQEWLIVRAVDSSFFEIETSDATSVAAIRSHFSDVRMA